MQPPCPNCDTPLAGSTIGYLCTNCGKAYRYADPDPAVDPLAQPHHHSGSEYAHDSAHPTDINTDNNVEPRDTALSEAAHPVHESDFSSAQITSHRRSSQVYRRDHQSADDLGQPTTPHEPGSLDTDTSHLYPPQHHSTAPHLSSEASIEKPETRDSWEQHDQARLTSTEVAHDDRPQPATEHETPLEEDDMSYGPHKPSPHILDVASAADTPAPYTPHSPLDLSKQPDHHYNEQAKQLDAVPELLPSFVDTQAPAVDQAPPIPTTSTSPQANSSAPQSDALARADALLAAASSPKTDTRSRSNMFLIIGIVAILLVISGLAFLLLKPPATTQPTSSATPVVSSPTTTPTNTQSLASKRDKQRKEDLNAISVALAAYKKSTGSYPVGGDISALAPLTTATPAYIAKINLDPLSDEASGVIVKYNYNSDGKTYTLTATLENKSDSDAQNGLYIVKSASTN
jgi:hypothetical protein